GIEHELELPEPREGNAYESDAERFPHALREAIDALEQGSMARAALGDDVVDHYLNYGRVEQRLFDEAVTCWERERLVERGWSRSAGSRATSRLLGSARGRSSPRSCRRTTSGRSSTRAGGRSSSRRARTGSRRRSTPSTASSSPGAPTSTRRCTGRRPTRRPTASSSSATMRSSRS